MEGIFNNKLKYYEYLSSKISHSISAHIIPFAQSDMVATFMEGIDPYLNNNIEGYILKIFDKYPEIIIENLCKEQSDKEILRDKLRKVSHKIAKEFNEDIKSYKRKVIT